ncbi:MAG: alpha-2-macroglobulin family protein, partial [Rhodobacteraceae bacterium]
MQHVLNGLVALLIGASTLWAQEAVPETRFEVSRDVDFYGSDLEAIFDTDLQSCLRACAANPGCRAFTFNSRSNACFPKSAVSDRQAYPGAVSAEKRASDAEAVAQGPSRAARLDFLPEGVLARAADEARDIGFRHDGGGAGLADILNAHAAALQSGDWPAALRWMGAAVAVTDRGEFWVEYARHWLALNPEGYRDRTRAQDAALLAAVNGYLRGPDAQARATALGVLAQVLEAQGNGRDMIPALRLALEETPREDLQAALDQAIGKYGFRIVETQVDSDSAAPRICAQFSEDLVAAGVDYEPYVQTADPTLVVSVQDATLCVDGVDHGQRYRVVFRAGLPAASGEALARDVAITQYVRDRAAQVRFPGRTYVLPKAADAAIPVETVNLNRVELKLRAVSDRNLLRAVQEGYFGRPLSKWEDEAFVADIAREVWTGWGEVRSELNRDMTTRLPLGEVLAGLPAGIYALSARDPDGDEYDGAGATQWFVLSDLGLTTFGGTDGLHLAVRGLSDAAPRAGVRLTLLSRANEVLGTALTDAEGWAEFAPGLTRGAGAAAPAMVLAETEGDLAFLSLTDPAFDLSDRGVQGRPTAGPVDVFLTPDRGAYRAGEVIHVTALTRDARMQAVEGLALVAILSRPDGVEHARRVSDGGAAGGHVFAFPLGETVPRGTWKLAVRTDPDGADLASTQVLVEDFLPERLDFTLSLPDAALRPGDTLPLGVEARYLFGAPGADLGIEGDAFLRPVRALADWPGFRFGRHDDPVRSRNEYFGAGRTDGDGRASVPVTLPATDAEGMPLEVEIVARIAEGSGRPVERRLSAPVLPAGPVIGIKPLFEDVVAEGAEAAFQVVALSPDLRPQPMRLRWTLNRIETRYQWFQLYGSWDWEPVTRRSRMATGEIAFDGAPLQIAAPVEWGRYELVVERLDGPYVVASQDFDAGWYAPADASQTPDTLDVSLDRADYAPGDVARLRIVPRHAGTALVTVLSNEVIARQVVEVSEGENLIPLEVTEAWGAGAYVTASVIRPMNVAAGQNPARSLGLAYARVAPGGRQ